MTTPPPAALPFDAAKLDRLIEEAGLDVLVVNSKHNLAYLLDRHSHHFFEASDAIGVSRYLPLLVYERGRPDRAAYIGNRNEKDLVAVRAAEGRPLWPPTVKPAASATLDATALAIDHLQAIGATGRRIGIEPGFLPFDAGQALAAACPDRPLGDATRVLELLRAVKTDAELATLRDASERVVAAMLAVMTGTPPGRTKREIGEALRREEVARGLGFDYALVTVGTGRNRAPSDERWEAGAILSLDSGGNLDGYLGDLCRMAILGEPDSELEDLLAEIRAIQDAARAPVRAGLCGGDVVAAGEAALARSPHRDATTFVAHGMGLIGHEAPRLTATGPIPYPDDDADRPLEAGMVLSIETTMIHPVRGFIKLEDTIAVTATGHEGFGDAGRGWTRGGQA